MAATDTAFELPTNRQSRYFNGPAPDVHDPNYIPVLNGAEIRVDFSQPSFSAFPSIPTPHTNASQTSLKRSKSATAPEIVPSSFHLHPVPSIRSTTSKSVPPQELQSSVHNSPVVSQENGWHASGSEDNSASASEGSTMSGPVANLEEQVFMIPGNAAPRAESMQFPTIPHSARSSISSTKLSNVPTSRYNKKQPSLPSIPPNAVQSGRVSSPLVSKNGSSDLKHVHHQQYQHANSEGPKSLPMVPLPVVPLPATPAVSPPQNLNAAKSSASERRARALHSHPLNLSLKARRRSQEGDEVAPVPQNTTSEPPSTPSRSRSQSICNSIQPTPAPDAPLPELPLIALKRPPTREKQAEEPQPTATPITQPVTVPPPAVPAPVSVAQKDHVEMGDFMSAKKTVVLRRFDEVHVRLLLHLQDEITNLEKQLLLVDQGGPGRPDKVASQANIMRELRKVLAEYDHLFANWSTMHANKANDETKEQLIKWLQNPAAGTGIISQGARDDLAWLHDKKDLSSVSIDAEKKKPEVPQIDNAVSKEASKEGGGGGGLLALFGCASKRK